MSSKLLLDLTLGSEKVGMVISLLFNVILFFLLVYKTNPNFGGYKHLMLCYTVIEMVYSIVGFSASSAAHSTNQTYIVFRYYNGPDRTIGPIFILQYCTAIFVLLLILSVHFVYRYVAVCDSSRLWLFNGKRLGYWVFGAIFMGVFASTLKYFFLGENPISTEHLRPIILEHYNLTMDQIIYNGPIYNVCDSNNKCGTSWSVWFVTVVIIGSLINCLFLMTVSGYLTYSNLSKNTFEMSTKTRSLQNQLFIALLIQSVIPIIFMYIPIALLFTSPIFGYSFGAYGNITMICIAIYPPLDQLAVMFIIRDFRDTIKQFVGLKKDKPSLTISNSKVSDSSKAATYTATEEPSATVEPSAAENNTTS